MKKEGRERIIMFVNVSQASKAGVGRGIEEKVQESGEEVRVRYSGY
jgi:hypothetical protein